MDNVKYECRMVDHYAKRLSQTSNIIEKLKQNESNKTLIKKYEDELKHLRQEFNDNDTVCNLYKN